MYNETVQRLRASPKLSKHTLRNIVALENPGKQASSLYTQKPYLLSLRKSVREQAVFEAFKANKMLLASRSGNKLNYKDKKSAREHGSTLNLAKDALFLSMKKEDYEAITRDEIEYDGLRRNEVLGMLEFRLCIAPKVDIPIGYFERPPLQWIKDGKMTSDRKSKGKLVKVFPPLECKLNLDPLGKLWVCAPVRQDVLPRKIRAGRVVGVDPGIRKVATCWFARDGTSFSIGDDLRQKFQHLFAKESELQSRRDKALSKLQRKHLRRKLLRAKERQRNLRDELHWKLCTFLTSNADTVVMGKMNVKSILENRWSRTKTSLAKRSKRELAAISHYMLRTRLIYKCAQKGVNIVIQPEAYTSQTCCACQHITRVGSAETFGCRCCGLVVDRDANSAANMVIKALAQ